MKYRFGVGDRVINICGGDCGEIVGRRRGLFTPWYEVMLQLEYVDEKSGETKVHNYLRARFPENSLERLPQSDFGRSLAS